MEEASSSWGSSCEQGKKKLGSHAAEMRTAGWCLCEPRIEKDRETCQVF